MGILSKALIVGGITLGVAAAAYGVFYYLKRGTGPKIVQTRENKEKLLKILEELTLEYAPVLSTYASILKGIEVESNDTMYRDQAKMIMTGRMRETINRVDEVVCQKYDITQEHLEHWIKAYENDAEIKAKDMLFQSALRSVLEGEIPDLKFNFPIELTKDVYYQAYRRILAMNLHMYYLGSQKEVKEGNKITNELISKITTQIEPERAAKRDNICEHYNITKGEGEDYSKIMLKAYYTYKRDENFFKQAEVLNKEYKLLMNLVFEGEIYPELDQDPSFLSNVQFEEFWNKIISRKQIFQPINPKEGEQKKEEEKVDEEIVIPRDENVNSTPEESKAFENVPLVKSEKPSSEES